MWQASSKCPRCTGHLLVAAVTFYLFLVVKLINCERTSDVVRYRNFEVNSGSEETKEILNFYAVNVLPDGEVETRVYYKGMFAKETSVGEGSDSILLFRELTDGKHFIQLIYNPATFTITNLTGEYDVDINFKTNISVFRTNSLNLSKSSQNQLKLKDCEYGHQRSQVKLFLRSFKSDLGNLIATNNVTVVSLDGRKLPVGFRWMNYTKLRKECHLRHLELKNLFKEGGKMEGDNVGRSKRDISDLFLVPGTKWCGKGYSADKYTRLGGFSKTDKCCRRHDLHCPFWIGGLQTKYGLFNWRMNTLMHCNCDVRFRACLKTVRSSTANLVGKLFFNVVQTKCFVLKPKKKCIRSSWWGKCEKFKMIKQAVLRNNLPY